MKSGSHTHYCPRCKTDKECYQITHCVKPEESVCVDCWEIVMKEK